MKEPVVADSTCLIGLQRINRLDLLAALFDPIAIPPAVEREFGIALPWLQVEVPMNRPQLAALKLLVDDGEAEAIALALEKGWRIILDDRQARTVARRFGLSMIGTVGVLARAKQNGSLAALKPLLEALEQSNFYISSALKEEALRLVGE